MGVALVGFLAVRDLRPIFAALAVACLALFVLAAFRDADREWKQYQQRFYALEAEHGKSAREKAFIRQTPLQIRQIVVEELGVVDRCITCHLAVESSLGTYSEPPFSRHPENPKHLYYQFPFDKYGCTVCHEGQGRATTASAAHGRVRYWDRPMLGGALLQSACLKCHDEPDLPGAELASRGRQLFADKECATCHRIGAEGGNIGPELTTVGLKTLRHYDFSRVKGEHTIENWHVEHLKDPPAIVPGSLMPPLDLTDEEARALTVYVLSLTGARVPQEYVARLRRPPPPPVGTLMVRPGMSRGEALYVEMRCYYCHAVRGRGGQVGPDLTDIGARRDRDWLGVHFRDPRAISPHSLMPNYPLLEADIAALTEYMLTLR